MTYEVILLCNNKLVFLHLLVIQQLNRNIIVKFFLSDIRIDKRKNLTYTNGLTKVRHPGFEEFYQAKENILSYGHLKATSKFETRLGLIDGPVKGFTIRYPQNFVIFGHHHQGSCLTNQLSILPQYGI